eukprot:CAMPEP_0119034710 /NCGR_PEP_ID=MMETSP1177-20130426/1731_1 /TAXON_ID=2985 /ORGANISM="Ochromonas sp, Strain CCMP1899" /LENGTH=129 /DNA_ID=CAMNT_0006992365 /DNA_START=262 /DNA_END=651 /DNA_ORIENTATION=+
MTLNIAKQIAAAAISEASENNWSVVCCILDDGGNLMYLERMDGTQIGSIQAAQDKASTAISFKRSTKDFQDLINANELKFLKMTNCCPIEGGELLVYDEQIIGSIGISGVTSAQDGKIAEAGQNFLQNL